MLNDTGFDLWADGYDRDVAETDAEDSYPFAGYRQVLEQIYRTIRTMPHAAVLDLGFGTGVLLHRLYGLGYDVYGQDFSARMLELAQAKMPHAALYLGDFTEGLHAPLLLRRYDYIVSTYALHHLTDERKIPFLRQLVTLLKPGGCVLIGDVAFTSRAALEQCQKDAGDEWDDEEFYFVADELKAAFPTLTFAPVSFCAGILSLTR